MSMLRHKPNIVLFGMGYSKERAAQFHWVGSYYSYSLGLIGKKSAHHNIKSLAEAKKMTIGAVRDDLGSSLLLKMGFPQSSIELSNNQESLFLKLKNDRVDLVSYSDDAAIEGMKKAGLNFAKYEMVYEIKRLKAGFGFSKQVPQHIIDDFQHALEDLVKSGAVKKILLKHKLLTE
jgi:ABC-type amino acid transport substrate-binding protein